MSFPDYVNKIINSQLKNKEIQSVRAEITKLISTNKIKKDHQEITETSKLIRIPKTMTNFFNVHSLSQQKDSKFEPKKTFSEMNINRLKQKLSLEEENKNVTQGPEPQQPSMNEWRLQMLKHLKPPPKQQINETKHERLTIECQNSHQQLRNISEKRKFKFSKTATSSPVMRRFEKKQKINHQVNYFQNRASSQKNIILIRPHPVFQEEEEKATTKMRKAVLKHKMQSRKSEAEDDDLNFQRLVSFTALLPFLGTQKAKVEVRQEKKYKIVASEVSSIPQKFSFHNQRKKKTAQQQVIEITGWDIHHD